MEAAVAINLQSRGTGYRLSHTYPWHNKAFCKPRAEIHFTLARCRLVLLCKLSAYRSRVLVSQTLPLLFLDLDVVAGPRASAKLLSGLAGINRCIILFNLQLLNHMAP